MTCEACKDVVEREDVPHVVRKCRECGRELHVAEAGAHGVGLKLEKGDTLRIPQSWLTLSLDPLRSRGEFSLQGIEWFAKLIFLDSFPKDATKFPDALAKLDGHAMEVLRGSALLSGLDLDSATVGDEAFRRLEENKTSAEWWAMLTSFFAEWAREALDEHDLTRAVWAAAGAERFRSMLVFKQHLESVVWMGHSAKRIVDVLRIWDNQKSNSDEEFWQQTFDTNAYVISQVFAAPMVFIKDKASVAGMNIDRKGAKFVDYLYSIESSREAIAVEIKTPMTRLLGAKYRGVYPPSKELGGAVVQVLDYRRELTQKLKALIESTEYDIEAFDPKCVLILGNGGEELSDPDRRRSFELFRASQKDVEIITYDELFRKVEILASLFNLTGSSA